MIDGREPNSSLLGELETLPPGEHVPRIQREKDVGRALQSLVDEATKLTTEETTRAISATKIVCALVDELHDDEVRAQARRAQARALSYAGRFDEALATCSEAIGIATNAGNPI